MKLANGKFKLRPGDEVQFVHVTDEHYQTRRSGTVQTDGIQVAHPPEMVPWSRCLDISLVHRENAPVTCPECKVSWDGGPTDRTGKPDVGEGCPVCGRAEIAYL